MHARGRLHHRKPGNKGIPGYKYKERFSNRQRCDWRLRCFSDIIYKNVPELLFTLKLGNEGEVEELALFTRHVSLFLKSTVLFAQ